jgi:hypothetical protein
LFDSILIIIISISRCIGNSDYVAWSDSVINNTELARMVVRNDYGIISGTILKSAFRESQQSSASIAGHCIDLNPVPHLTVMCHPFIHYVVVRCFIHCPMKHVDSGLNTYQ